MTKHLKCLVNNTNDIVDHLMSEDDEDGWRIIGGGKVEKAAGGKGTGGSEKEKEKKKGKEVEVEKGAEKGKEVEVVVEKETGPTKLSSSLIIIIFSFIIYTKILFS